MRQNILLVVLVSCVAFFADRAYAELDPELAEVGNKNESGFFVSTGLGFGQAYATGGSNPGLALLLNVEPGYVATRDSWGRIEASLQLSTGQIEYTDKDDDGNTKVTLSVGAMALGRIGYGWSMGHSAFGLLRLGVGPVVSNYEGKTSGVTSKSDGSLSGIAGQLGYDMIFGVNDWIDVFGAFSLTHISTELGDAKVNGETVSVDEPINLNVLALSGGIRFTF